MRHTVTVLQDDIDQGEPGSAQKCAVALAVLRDVPAARQRFAGVGPGSLVWYTGRPGVSCELQVPDEVTRFIRQFDFGHQVEPFKFEVEVPQ